MFVIAGENWRPNDSLIGGLSDDLKTVVIAVILVAIYLAFCAILLAPHIRRGRRL